MSSNSTLVQGGIAYKESNNYVSFYNVSTITLTLGKELGGDFSITGKLNIKEDANAESNVTIQKNLVVSGDISGTNFFAKNDIVSGNNILVNRDLNVSGNINANTDIRIYGNLHAFKNIILNEQNNAFIYASPTGNVGINTTDAKSILDISGSSKNTLNVYTSQPTNFNVLARNVNNRGISLSSNNTTSTIGFYNDTSINEIFADATIKYSTGIIQIDASNSTRIHSQLSISKNTLLSPIYNETVIVQDIPRSSPYLYDTYNKTGITTGTAMSLVSSDNSSNTFLNIISPNKTGISIGGGSDWVYKSRSTGTIGLLNASGDYHPSLNIVSGISNIQYKSTIGINTHSPLIDSYILDVNGPIHFSNGELTLTKEDYFEILKMNISRTFPNYIVAVGTPFRTTTPFQHNTIYSTDGGNTWNNIIDSPTSFVSISLTNINDTYVFDNSLSILVGENKKAYYGINGGRNWYPISFLTSDNFTITSVFITYKKRIFIACSDSKVRWFDTPPDVYNDTTGFSSINDVSNGIIDIVGDMLSTNSLITGHGDVLYLTINNTIERISNIHTTNDIIYDRHTSVGNQPFKSICAFNSDYITAISKNWISYTYNGTDNAVSWTNVPMNGELNSVYVHDMSNTILVGNNGLIAYTNDGNVTWKTMNLSMLNTSGNGKLLIDPSFDLTNVVMRDLDHFIITQRISKYNSLTNTLGKTRIFHCFFPNIFNNSHNYIMDLSGSVRISGDININDKGRIETNNDVFYLVNRQAKSLYVAGDASFILVGNSIDSKLIANHDIVVSNDASLNNNLYVDGNTFLYKNVFVSGDSSLNSNVFVGGNTVLNREVNVNGNASIDKALFVVGDVSMGSNLVVSRDTSMNGILKVGGNTTLYKKLFVVDDVSMGSNLVVLRDTSMNGTLNIDGNAVLNSKMVVIGDVSMGSNLVVSRDTSMNGILNVGGNTTIYKALFVVDDVSMGSNLVVLRDTSMNGTLNVVGNAVLNSKMVVIGDVSMGSNLVVLRDTSMNGTLNVGGNAVLNSKMVVVGDVSMGSNLVVSRDTSMNGILNVDGNTTLYKKLFVIDDVSMGSNLVVIKNTTMAGTLNVGSNSILTRLNVKEDASFNSNLLVLKDASFNGTFKVFGNTTINSKLFVVEDVSMGSNLVVIKDSSFNGTFKVGGNVTLNSNLSLSGVASFNSNLVVVNDASFNSALKVAGNTNINSKLYVIGDVSMGSNLVVIKDSSFNGTFKVGGNATLNSNLSLSGVASFNANLVVANDASFNSALKVAGNTNINSKLYVLGDVSMGSNLVVISDASINGALKVGGTTTINGNLIVSNINAIYSNGYEGMSDGGNIFIGSKGIFYDSTPASRTIYIGTADPPVGKTQNTQNIVKIGGGRDRIIFGGEGISIDKIAAGKTIVMNQPESVAGAYNTSKGSGLLFSDNSANERAGFVLISDDCNGFLFKSPANSNILKLDLASMIIPESINSGILTLKKTPVISGSASESNFITSVGSIDVSNVMIKKYAITDLVNNVQIIDTSMGILGKAYVSNTMAVGKTTSNTNISLDVAGNVYVDKLNISNLTSTQNSDYKLELSGNMFQSSGFIWQW